LAIQHVYNAWVHDLNDDVEIYPRSSECLEPPENNYMI
jgi:hypothetical protein